MSGKGNNDEPITKKPRTAEETQTQTTPPPAAKDHPSSASAAAAASTPLSFTLEDEQLLDCPICFYPLSSPVYQCKNGHVACASCCDSIKKKCPSCSCVIGTIRCRVLENIVESITLNCPNKVYGCHSKLSYAEKLDHVERCKYVPCSCPLPGCDFVGLCGDLYEHFSISHRADHSFSFGSFLNIELGGSQEHAFIQEKYAKVVFVLTQIAKPYGTHVKVVCIAPAASSAYICTLEIGIGPSRGFLRLTARVQCRSKWTAELPTTSYLMVPNDLLGSQLRLQLNKHTGMEFFIFRLTN